jgi:dethiobiotin synthetase
MRIVVLGCGTGVGKTRVSVALLRGLVARGQNALGLKPVETGFTLDSVGVAISDASALMKAGSHRPSNWLPAFNFAAAVSPHLAARNRGTTIDLRRVSEWVSENELGMAPSISSHSANWTVVETAGGVFSPLSPTEVNFDLAVALEPATWVLVAADALGVLHDVSATLQAMRARGRVPDHVVLSGARDADASTGSNATELAGLGICQVTAVLARNDDSGIAPLVSALDPSTYG